MKVYTVMKENNDHFDGYHLMQKCGCFTSEERAIEMAKAVFEEAKTEMMKDYTKYTIEEDVTYHAFSTVNMSVIVFVDDWELNKEE